MGYLPYQLVQDFFSINSMVEETQPLSETLEFQHGFALILWGFVKSDKNTVASIWMDGFSDDHLVKIVYPDVFTNLVF